MWKCADGYVVANAMGPGENSMRVRSQRDVPWSELLLLLRLLCKWCVIYIVIIVVSCGEVDADGFSDVFTPAHVSSCGVGFGPGPDWHTQEHKQNEVITMVEVTHTSSMNPRKADYYGINAKVQNVRTTTYGFPLYCILVLSASTDD